MMAWLVILLLYFYMETHFILTFTAPFLDLPSNTKREKRLSEYCTMLLLMAGIEPRAPLQQASVLSITPLPLGTREEINGIITHLGHLVVGPEVMTPLAAAMDLVDGQLVEDSELVALLQLGHEPLALGQLLRCDVQQPHRALGVSHVLRRKKMSPLIQFMTNRLPIGTKDANSGYFS